MVPSDSVLSPFWKKMDFYTSASYYYGENIFAKRTMQLYALDQQQQYIAAHRASKQIDYQCPECRGRVRLRGGEQRQNHFYHCDATPDCRQHGKSLEHLQLQLHFLEKLPQGECQLEQRFETIGRVADVVWEPQRLIFEIQCSFITATEVMARNRDYNAQGFTVIWILHCRKYNRRRLTSMERLLQGLPHYFSDMDGDGRGMLFDQFTLVHRGLRTQRLPALAIDILSLKRYAATPGVAIPLRTVKKRLEGSPIYFGGDLVDCALCDSPSDYMQQAAALELAAQATDANPKLDCSLCEYIQQWIHRWLLRPYRLLLQMAVEKASR
jgi:competence protein CoiA